MRHSFFYQFKSNDKIIRAVTLGEKGAIAARPQVFLAPSLKISQGKTNKLLQFLTNTPKNPALGDSIPINPFF